MGAFVQLFIRYNSGAKMLMTLENSNYSSINYGCEYIYIYINNLQITQRFIKRGIVLLIVTLLG